MKKKISKKKPAGKKAQAKKPAKKPAKKSAKRKAKRPIGRPRKYTLAQLEKRVRDYFEARAEDVLPVTVTGLALSLDTTRETLCEWEKEGHEFSYTIKRAKLMVEHAYEVGLVTARSPGGFIFGLKNFGWTDRQELTGADGAPLGSGYDPEKLKNLSTEKLKDLHGMLKELQ